MSVSILRITAHVDVILLDSYPERCSSSNLAYHHNAVYKHERSGDLFFFFPHISLPPLFSPLAVSSGSLSISSFITVWFLIIFLCTKPHCALVEIDSSHDTNQFISPFIARFLLIISPLRGSGCLGEWGVAALIMGTMLITVSDKSPCCSADRERAGTQHFTLALMDTSYVWHPI